MAPAPGCLLGREPRFRLASGRNRRPFDRGYPQYHSVILHQSSPPIVKWSSLLRQRRDQDEHRRRNRARHLRRVPRQLDICAERSPVRTRVSKVQELHRDHVGRPGHPSVSDSIELGMWAIVPKKRPGTLLRSPKGRPMCTPALLPLGIACDLAPCWSGQEDSARRKPGSRGLPTDVQLLYGLSFVKAPNDLARRRTL